MRTDFSPAAYRILAVAAQVLAFLYSALSLLRPGELLVDTFNDDAAYYLTIARNYAAGHGWTFDRLAPTNGFQPLWQYLLVGLCRLLPGSPESQVRWTGLTETVLESAAGFLLWRLIDRQLGARAGALMTVVFVSTFYFLTRTGMETALFAVLVAGVLTVVARGNPWRAGYGTAASFGLLLGAMMLTRLDSVFFAGTLVITLLADGLRRGTADRARLLGGCAAGCAVAALVVVPYLAYNLAAFGHLMPISGAVKSSFPVPGWYLPAFGLSGEQRGFFLASNLFAAAALVWRFGPGRSHPSTLWRCGLTALALGVLVHHLYSALFMKWGVMSWHFALGRLLACVLLAVLIERAIAITPSRGHRAAAVAVCLVMLLGGGFAVYRRDWGMLSKNWRRMSHDAAIWVHEHLPADAILAMKDSGHMGLFSERRVVNLDGIVNSFEYQERMRRGEFAAYVEDTGIDYIVYGPPPRPYGTFQFHSGSHLYDAPGGFIELHERDEVYRSPEFWTPLGPHTLVVCRVPR